MKLHDSKKLICVFAGSSTGNAPIYLEAAQTVGREIATRKWGLIYGGAKVGLMGALADSALQQGGDVFGVIPKHLFPSEGPHDKLTRVYEVESLQERKSLMIRLASAFIVLPGGFGTYDELLEIITEVQLGLESKPISLLNVNDYFTPFKSLVDHAMREGFIPERHGHLFTMYDDPIALIEGTIGKPSQKST